MSADVVMADANAAASPSGVDEGLYSRQLYVFGHEAQQKLQAANVLMVGLRGLGVETAKNVILAGVKSVGLLDHTPVSISDLGAQFYLTEQDIGKPRDEVCFSQLQSLNPYVNVHLVKEAMSVELLAQHKYQILCLTNSNLTEATKYNEFCHANGIKFLWAEVPGVYASIFVDFPSPLPNSAESDAQLSATGHYVSDLTGELPMRGLIAHVSCSNPGVVTVHEDARHGLQDGDWVTFEEVTGMKELNIEHSQARPVKVLTPYTFTIEDTTLYTPYTGTKGYFQQVKRGRFFQFGSLAETLLKDTPISNDNWGNEKSIHLLHVALGRFQANKGRLPRPDTWEDAREIVGLVHALSKEVSPPVEGLNEYLLANMARVASAELNPLCAFMGGVLGQEVLKGASSKFVPIQQYYYYDGSHVLPSEAESQKNPVDLQTFAPRGSRYDSQIAVFGVDMQEKLQALSYFVVGAGAIGCEMVKNFAMMGLGTGKSASGKPATVYITDMDTIERSNLNRQFLFREHNVGHNKSTAAAAAVKVMNPSLNIVSHSVRVAPQTEDLYDDHFFESLDGVVTALDNVEARIYVDGRCVYYQKPMIDSGTLGTKGSTQVVVPFLTESYGSTRDPPEESTPICTLKNFPHKIEHTIQYARDHFEGLFKAGPSEVNNYLTGGVAYLEDLAKQQNIQLQNLQTIKTYLIDDKPNDFAACVRWARMLFEEEYHYKIAQLLHNFPADSTTAEGQPFWSGAKRPPVVLNFDASDATMIDFILSASNLRAANYNLPQSRDLECVRAVLATIHPKPFTPQQNAKIATTEAEAKEMLDKVEDDHDTKVQELTTTLPVASNLPSGYHLQSLEFEKDDATNFHIDFITACSNLRARNYAIKEQDKHQTKFTAGKIIPAIATTTALVTGMVCLELYKLVQPSKNKIDDFRCFSCNLALPMLSSSEPIAPAKSTSLIKSGEWTWTLWDRIDVDEGDITLEQFMEFFKEKYGLEVTMLSHGASMIYYNFGVGLKKKVKDRLKEKISDLVQSVGGVVVKPKDRYLILEACVQNEDEEEVEIPCVRFKFRQ